MQIRKATPADTPFLAQVFYASVRTGPSNYTQAQRVAWMPYPPNPDEFASRLASAHVFVSEGQGVLTGFITLEPGGYIDLAYILPDCRRRGVFRKLYAAIEEVALTTQETRLWTHASLMAQPAFRAMGFLVMHHEKVERAGEQLARAQMEKFLI